MAACCGCCAALKPRYKRLVDNIFPVIPEDGLVKNNMAQLTFYAVSSPDKLDKIGQYLEQRLNREVHRHRIPMVFNVMDALDQLLKSCHAQSLNLFVESFLKMVQKLLECEESELQILATNSFVKFANIEEDTPSYHRRYDFFVSKFSSMCHSSISEENTRVRIRQAGLSGLQGVVRKTVSDDLQVNIWDPVHMDKIVPSLLYNMDDGRRESCREADSPRDEESPSYAAETVFRDLVCRASYGYIETVLRPVLIHFDNHQLWSTNKFAIKCFKIIMYSVQAQYGYLVIQSLLKHLDKHVKSDPNVKAGIIGVLFEAVLIAAGGSIGPSVLEVFNNLLRHLRISVDNKSHDKHKRLSEKKFEEAIINTIGEFANNLPDYQKIEIMMFVMGKFPQFTNEEDVGGSMDTQLQINLLKTLLKVATKYKTMNMQNAFPPEFLHPLLRMSLLDDPGMRIIVQDILHTMIDRHDNSDKLKTVMLKNVSELELTVEKTTRQDIMFMKKSGMQFYWHLYENMQMETNRVDNFEALYCTMVLICIEMGGDEILVELFRLALDIQQMAVTNTVLPLTHKCAIHGLIAAYLNLISQLTAIPQLSQYITQVIDLRKSDAQHLLPGFAYNRTNRPHSYPSSETIKDNWLFSQAQIAEALAGSGHDTSRLSTPFTHKPMGSETPDIGRSVSDIGSINIEVESVDGSPSASRRKLDEEITVESLKKMLAEDSCTNKEFEDRRRREILETFQKAPFEEIVARSEAKSNHFHNKLSEILDMVEDPVQPSSTTGESDVDKEGQVNQTSVPVFEMQFPDLFVY